MKIGIFDSGIGGLSLLHCAAKLMPYTEFLYYADTDNVPYGEKPREEIVRFSDKAVGFLCSLDVDGVVVACNTATSAAIDELRKKYENGEGAIPIIGMEPAVKKAIDICEKGRVLAAATPLTVKGIKLKSLIERFDTRRRTDTVPLPGLVRLAENGEFDRGLDYIENELCAKGVDISKYSALVLGCTHFNYFKDSFKKLLPPDAKIVDGCLGTVNQLIRRTGAVKEESDTADVADIMSRTRFFRSGRSVTESADLRSFERALCRLCEMDST